MRSVRLWLPLSFLALVASCSSEDTATLGAGTCFNDSSFEILEDGGQVNTVDCDEPHDNQIVATVEGAPQTARPLCEELLTDRETFELLVVSLDDEGDSAARHACVAFRRDFEKHVGLLPEAVDEAAQVSGGTDE